MELPQYLKNKNMLGELTFGDCLDTFGEMSGIEYGGEFFLYESSREGVHHFRRGVHHFRSGAVELKVQENARVFVDWQGAFFRNNLKRFELK